MGSQRSEPQGSPCPGPPAADFVADFIESNANEYELFDNFAGLRNDIRRMAGKIGEYAGIPMPLDDDELVVEPSYRNAVGLIECGKHEEDPDDGDRKILVRNSFWSTSRRCWICVWEDAGKIGWTPVFENNSFYREIHTIGCSVAWGIEQEANAVQTLAGLVRHHQMKCYLLTGSFLERSQRSNLMYMFRKLRPTVVMSACDMATTRILCTLCLHPIAYYRESGAGCMAPTDDVIAHLMLMRGDEHMLWRRANQHPPWHPSSRIL